MPFAQRPQGQNDLPAHQAKVARIEGHIEAQHGAEHAIEDRSAGALEPRLTQAALANRIDDVIAFAPASDHVAHHLGRILKIRIHHHDRFSLGPVGTGSDRDLVAEVARQRYQFVARFLLHQFLEQSGRGISRAVIDENDFPGFAQVVQEFAQAAIEFGNRPFLVEDGDDDRQGRTRF